MSEEQEGPVGTLEGPAAVERVVTEEDGRTYSCRCLVGRLAGGVYDFAGVEPLFSNPVPVRGLTGDVIGFANLFLEGANLVADTSVRYDSEERLLAETGSQRLYARTYGRLVAEAMPVFDFQAPIRVTAVLIDGVQLTQFRPADGSQPPYGTPVP